MTMSDSIQTGETVVMNKPWVEAIGWGERGAPTRDAAYSSSARCGKPHG